MIALAGLALLGCTADPGVVDLEAEVSEHIATVVTVRWTTEEPEIGLIEYGPTEELGLLTQEETAPSTEHVATLLRPSESDTWLRPVVRRGSRELLGDLEVVTTGALPSELPSLTVEGGGHDRWHALPIIGGLAAPVILDPDGEIVWYWLDDRGLDVYRVRLDGDSVLYNAASVSGDPADDSALVRVAIDGSWEEATPVPLLAHDFVLLPEGGVGAITVEYRDVEGEEVRGDRIVEVSAEGDVTQVWSAWDCYDPAELPGDEHGWTFANALDLSPEGDTWYLGMRAFSTIQRIDRATGECGWALGGQAATIDVVQGLPFLHQHQFEVLDEEHVLVFDNDGQAGASRAVEYALDLGAGTAAEVWSYTASPSIYSFVLGDVKRLEGGDTLVTWSVGGQIDRVDPEGQVSWQVNTELGYALGFDTIYDALPL